MFHPWSKWKGVVPCIPKVTVETVKIHPWSAECAKESYKKFSNQICLPIVKLLTGNDPVGQALSVHKAKDVQMKSSTGATITGRQNITFADEVTEEELKEMMEKPDAQRDAIHALKTIDPNLVVQTLLNASHPKRNQVLGLVRLAPEFSLDSLSTPDMLVDLGIWPEVKGWQELQRMPRYFVGRDILVRANVNPAVDAANYMMYDPSSDKFATHNARLVGRDGGDFVVELQGSEKPIKVPVVETLEMNQPHVFALDVKGDIVFEDALVFATKGNAEKAKLIEMAFKLAPLVERLDFTAPDCFEVQCEAIKAIRSCLDFIANNVGEEKIMHADRATTGHVGRLSLRGQGSCHGCSSVMGSYLYHFAPLLGLDVKYRSGYSHHGRAGDRAHPTMDRHQTLEVTCRPSMKSVIVDLWYEGVMQDASFACTDAQAYYQHIFYPNCFLQLSCRS